MSSTSHVKNIAIVGATGRSGSAILSHLVASSRFKITCITRTSSSTLDLPASVQILAGSYSDPAFLASALESIDCLVITLGTSAPAETQHSLIEAAVKADVKFILPNEFGFDSTDGYMGKKVSVQARKQQYRDRVEELAGKYGTATKWIGIINGPWFDFSLDFGAFGIAIPKRTVRFYGDGDVPITTSTLAQMGRGVASLLSLPLSTLFASDISNDFVHVHSFNFTQHELLASLNRVLDTTDADWDITSVDTEEAVKHGGEKLAKGDYSGLVDHLYGAGFWEGHGGDYKDDKSKNELLGLKEEDLDEEVRKVIHAQRKGKKF